MPHGSSRRGDYRLRPCVKSIASMNGTGTDKPLKLSGEHASSAEKVNY